MKKSFWIRTALVFFLSLQLSAENSQEKNASSTAAQPPPSSLPTPLASDNFQILEFKAPSEAAPGAKIACTVKMKVIAGNPQFPRPSGHIIWNDGKDSKPIPGEAFVPWQFLSQEAGQELSFTVNLQIPENVEIGGKVKLQFTMFGVNDGKYIYGTIFRLDGTRSTSYIHIITVKKLEALSL